VGDRRISEVIVGRQYLFAAAFDVAPQAALIVMGVGT
jgi:hypothetical protein